MTGTQIYRDALLQGVTVTLAQPARPALVSALTDLGAELTTGEVDALVVDVAAHEGDPGLPGRRGPHPQVVEHRGDRAGPPHEERRPRHRAGNRR